MKGFPWSRKRQISTPTLVNKSWNDDVYSSLTPIPGKQKDKRYYSKDLPAVPTKPLGSPFSERRPNVSRGNSSYSQISVVGDRAPSISLSHHFPQDQDSFSISPPDSPVFIGHGPESLGSSRVSSIANESREQLNEQTGSTFTSHIPVASKRAGSLHPESRREATAPRTSTSPSSTSGWDSVSRKSSDMNRLMGAAPAYSFETNITADARPGEPRNANILDWGKEQKRKLSGARNRPAESDLSLPPTREPWKGPSGRAPIIDPIQENPRAKSSSRLHTSRSSDRLRGTNSPSPDYSYLGIVPSVVTTITAGEPNTKGPEKHVPNRNIPQTRVPEEPTPPSTSASSRTPPRVDLPGPDLSDPLAELKLGNDDDFTEPVSRFSTTTYEPTEADSSTATESRRNSIDTASQSTDNIPSIMSRKRPVPSAVAPGKKPTRKPTPSQATGAPESPSQSPPQDRIQMLESRKEYLARRKASINTMIHELTQVIQPSPVAYDMAAREEVKKTVASLNNELAEITKEEHEIGMKIFRTLRKRDERNFGSGSATLWVKRVTS
ncbi:hypothetical protein BDV25DRAFT_49041 [Aspergillus avenaceus]|uniref:BHLH domain-containing protein n=1 Tax=Aspergillus avenaceus TaxID=36643 RepID=A0A5N6TJK3_ASPAV|nr:hypothetical protein BDV25DRAFT_49041 [Aspergillus avenaceus]